MYSKVKRLRARGARRSDREIGSDPGVVGHVTMATIGHTKEMKLHAAGDDSRRAPIIPLLYEPTIQAMHGARMLVSGLERQGDQADPAAPLFMQEWAIEVMLSWRRLRTGHLSDARAWRKHPNNYSEGNAVLMHEVGGIVAAGRREQRQTIVYDAGGADVWSGCGA
ncbi:MAG: hypothetical protein WKG03_03345 [Telluria sp.]